ncbi:hypothetical protein D3C74_429210 [compost metagenome]
MMRMKACFLSRHLIRFVADENKLQVPGGTLNKEAVQQGIQTVKPPLPGLIQIRLCFNLPFAEARQINNGSHLPGLQTLQPWLITLPTVPFPAGNLYHLSIL